MTTREFITVGLLVAAIPAIPAIPAVAAEKKDAKSAAAKINYEDHVLPVFRDNCLKCHNPDKLKGDLDLSTYSGTLKGGGSGQGVAAGDADGSMLVKVMTHAAEPFMPPNSPKVDAKLVDTIRKWIDGGLLETATGKAMVGKPKVDLSVAVSAKRPEGPPPMPAQLPLDPPVELRRATALSAMAASPWAPIVALGAPKQIVFYNTDDLEYVGVMPYPEGFPADIKFSRNGKLLLVGGGRGAKTGEVIVWDITRGERIIKTEDQFDTVLAADISADQKWIALGGPNRLVKIYDTSDGSLEHKIKKHTDWVTAMEFSPNGKFLCTGDRAGGVMLWETVSGQEMFPLNGHRGAITSVSWRDDSEVVLTASEDGTVKVWKASDGSSIKSISANNNGVLAARYAHDGRIVTSGRDNRVLVWDAAGNNSKPMTFSGELPNRAVFAHDDKRVIASDYDGRVMVWNVEDGKVIGELEANPPTLANRVERDTKRIVDLQAETDKFAAEHAKLEAEAKIASDVLDKVEADLAQTQKDSTAKEQEIKKLEGEAKTNEAAKGQLTTAREALKKLQADAKRLSGTELENRRKQLEASQKKSADVKVLAERAVTRVAAAKTSLAKWKAARSSAPKVASK